MSIERDSTVALSHDFFATRDAIRPNPAQVGSSLGSLVNRIDLRFRGPVFDMRLIAETILRAGGGHSVEEQVVTDRPAQYTHAIGPLMKNGYFYRTDRTYDYFISPFSFIHSDPYRSRSIRELRIQGLGTTSLKKGLLPDAFRKDLTIVPLDNINQPEVPFHKNPLPSEIILLDKGNPTKTNKPSLADLLLKPEKPLTTGICDDNVASSGRTVRQGTPVLDKVGRYIGQSEQGRVVK